MDMSKKYWTDIFNKLKKITNLNDNLDFSKSYEGMLQLDQTLYCLVVIK